MHAKLLQSCLTLCNPMGCSLPDSSIHGILQAGILEWVAMPSFRGSSPPRDQTGVSYISFISRWVLYHQCHLGLYSFIISQAPMQEEIICNNLTLSISQISAAVAAAAKSLQSCPTLCDPIDGSPPGSPNPGILQAKTLEWVAISFSNA